MALLRVQRDMCECGCITPNDCRADVVAAIPNCNDNIYTATPCLDFVYAPSGDANVKVGSQLFVCSFEQPKGVNWLSGGCRDAWAQGLPVASTPVANAFSCCLSLCSRGIYKLPVGVSAALITDVPADATPKNCCRACADYHQQHP